MLGSAPPKRHVVVLLRSLRPVCRRVNRGCGGRTRRAGRAGAVWGRRGGVPGGRSPHIARDPPLVVCHSRASWSRWRWGAGGLVVAEPRAAGSRAGGLARGRRAQRRRTQARRAGRPAQGCRAGRPAQGCRLGAAGRAICQVSTRCISRGRSGRVGRLVGRRRRHSSPGTGPSWSCGRFRLGQAHSMDGSQERWATVRPGGLTRDTWRVEVIPAARLMLSSGISS